MDRLRTSLVVIALLLHPILVGSRPAFAVDNLIDHNGLVLTNPRLFVVYWGVDWQNGFNDSISGLPSTTYRSYLEDFLNGVGGGAWLITQAQYRGASSPLGVIAGTWVDAGNALPVTPTQGQIEEEVRRAAEHFNVSSDPQAVYLIALPPGHADKQAVAKGGTACAWHSRAWNNNFINSRDYPYITLPYMPDQGGGCAPNLVNPGFDFSGHGIFDGVSKTGGHEWAEVLTDPLLDAWYDIKGAENGDKRQFPRQNIGVGGDYYAVQALWSNVDGGCVLAGVPTADQAPNTYDFGPNVRYSTSSPLTVQLTNNGNLDLPLTFVNNTPWYLTGVNPKDFLLSGQSCPKLLHPGASCSVQVTFRPLDFGTRQVTLAVNIQGSHTGNSTPLVGDGIPQWAVFDQNILAFPSTWINSPSSAPLTVHLENQGAASQMIQQVQLGGPNAPDFLLLSDGCSDHGLEPAGSCPIVLQFLPTANGERDAELEITGAGGTQFGIPIEGTGLGPVAELTPSELVFDENEYDSSGAAPPGEIPVSGEVQEEVTLTNIGQGPPLLVEAVEVTGDFVLESNGCTHLLEPGNACSMQVRLRPVHFQDQSGRLMIYDNTSDSPHEVTLSGSVEAAIPSFVVDSLDFGIVRIGRKSAPQTVELENLEGEVPLHIQSISASGEFAATSDCPSDLAIGRCAISVTVTPAGPGTRRGTLQVLDDAPGSPHQIPLVGTARGVNCGLGAELAIWIPLLRLARRARRNRSSAP